MYVGREATVIVKANSDTEIELSTTGNRVMRLILANGEIFKFKGYVDAVNVNGGAASIFVLDSDADINIQVSSSGIIAELEKLAKESTVQGILTEAQNTNNILAGIDGKLAQPSQLDSTLITMDNSGGTSDLVQQLFPDATPSRSAVIKRAASGTGDGNPIYIGGPASQALSFNVGDILKTEIDDLSKIYVRVPAGVTAVLEVLWEV